MFLLRASRESIRKITCKQVDGKTNIAIYQFALEIIYEKHKKEKSFKLHTLTYCARDLLSIERFHNIFLNTNIFKISF
jgi:hypothetical protein